MKDGLTNEAGHQRGSSSSHLCECAIGIERGGQPTNQPTKKPRNQGTNQPTNRQRSVVVKRQKYELHSLQPKFFSCLDSEMSPPQAFFSLSFFLSLFFCEASHGGIFFFLSTIGSRLRSRIIVRIRFIPSRHVCRLSPAIRLRPVASRIQQPSSQPGSRCSFD